MKIKKVEVTLLSNASGDDLSPHMYRKCIFCQKTVFLNQENLFSCDKLSGKGKFFCPFCIRNSFHLSEQHVLIFSFRAIFGHYYYTHYNGTSANKLYLNEIKKMIYQHEKAGLKHPGFSYDSEDYLWFVNFSKVLRFEESIQILTKITQSFRIEEIYNEDVYNTVLGKFANSFKIFYRTRKRPNSEILIPTFKGCFAQEFENKYYVETRLFSPNLLKTY
jgi:hypothetical protein